METKFIFGINLLVAVPTTLRSVKFASYPSSIVRHVIRKKNTGRRPEGLSKLYMLCYLVLVLLFLFVCTVMFCMQ